MLPPRGRGAPPTPRRPYTSQVSSAGQPSRAERVEGGGRVTVPLRHRPIERAKGRQSPFLRGHKAGVSGPAVRLFPRRAKAAGLFRHGQVRRPRSSRPPVSAPPGRRGRQTSTALFAEGQLSESPGFPFLVLPARDGIGCRPGADGNADFRAGRPAIGGERTCVPPSAAALPQADTSPNSAKFIQIVYGK